MTDFFGPSESWTAHDHFLPTWDPQPPVWRPTSLALPPVRRTLLEHLDAQTAHIAVLDARGCVLAVNEAWRSFARAAGVRDPNFALGMNYLEVCQRAEDESAHDAQIVAGGIRDVIGGQFASVYFRYGYELGPQRSLFGVRISRLRHEPELRISVEHERIL